MSSILFRQPLASHCQSCDFFHNNNSNGARNEKGRSVSFVHGEQHGYCSGYGDLSPKLFKLLPLPRAASSSAGAPAQYPGQSLDWKSKRENKRIAGIDQDELLDPELLADPDSCFCEFKGIRIHYKVYSNAEYQVHSQAVSVMNRKLDLPIILLHGFGASVFSWNRVMKPLAQLVTTSKVLAFDRPAFGLTSRVDYLTKSGSPGNTRHALNPYSTAFSTLATLYFIDFLAADKAILVGHSAGSLVAVNSYFEAPERIAALILVAPAIFAPFSVHKVAKDNKMGKDRVVEGGDISNSNILGKPFIKLLETLAKFADFIVQAIMQVVKGMTNMLNSWYKKTLSAILCSWLGVMLVRMVIDKFGIEAVRNAWYDSNRVTEHVLDGYTKPLRIKGWDKALAEFTAAMFANLESESKPPISEQLHQISCPGNCSRPTSHLFNLSNIWQFSLL
uniref:AB hydrolase-1 domain-containing protein n=1 Tax=Rhizophora mucronata TaxID=61149 RepID=A0A2P2JJJ3_RHIMU